MKRKAKPKKICGVEMRQLCVWMPLSFWAMIDEIVAQKSASGVPTDMKRVVLNALHIGMTYMLKGGKK
jgi:hypothetical protein